MMLTKHNAIANNKRIIFYSSLLLGLIGCLCSFDAMAMDMNHDAAMKAGLESLEKTVQGGWARMAAIGAILMGFFMSMFKSSPNPIIISCLVVVIAKIVMAYADSSFTALI